MAQARVLYAYDAEQDDELSLDIGSTIINVNVQDGGWWEGEVNGKRGVFPENFVELIITEEPPKIKKEQPPMIQKDDNDKKGPPKSRIIKAKVTFDYVAEQEDELSLHVGETVEIYAQEEDGWWEGQVNEKSGVFPSNFVSVISDEEVEMNSKTSTASRQEPRHLTPEPDITSTDVDGAAEKPKKALGFGFALNPADLMRNKLKPVSGSDSEAKKPTQKVPPLELKSKKSEPVVNGMGTPTKRNAPPPPKEPAKTSEEPKKSGSDRYIVLFDYAAVNDDELNLKVGDILIITDKDVCEGWWEGQLRGKTGVFPDNFVQPAPSEETTMKDKPLPKKPMLPPGKSPSLPGKETDKSLPVPPPQNTKPPLPSMTHKPAFDSIKRPPPHHAKTKPPPPQPPRPGVKKTTVPEPNEFPKANSLSRKGPPPQPPKTATPPIQSPKVAIAVTPPPNKQENGVPNGEMVFDLDVVVSDQSLQHVNKNRIKGPAKNLPARYSAQFKDDEVDLREDPAKKDEPAPSPSSNTAPPWMKEVKKKREPKSVPSASVPSVSAPSVSASSISAPPSSSSSSSISGEKEVATVAASTAAGSSAVAEATSTAATAASAAASATSAAASASKIAEECKKSITELRDKMIEMEKRFMKHIKVLTNDLDSERKERANLHIEIDRLKKKVDILEGH